jgi:hypothetical protein
MNYEYFIPEGTFRANLQKFYKIFEDNIPLVDAVRKFPGHYMVPYGFSAYSILFGLYVFFFCVAYLASVEESFISLDKAAGVCSEVKKPLSGTYLAASNGAWEGDSEFKVHQYTPTPLHPYITHNIFIVNPQTPMYSYVLLCTRMQYSEALYQFTFSGLETTDAEFSTLVGVDFSTNKVAAFMRVHDITDNLLALMHYREFATVGDKVRLVQYITLHYITVQYSTVQCSAGVCCVVGPFSNPNLFHSHMTYMT